MTGGEIAAIIVAVAFAALVVALVYVLLKVADVITELNHTVSEANQALRTLTKDTDQLLVEVEGLLNKSNVTLEDVNGKMSLLTPLFKAIGDLGQTVSDLNASSRNLASSLTSFTQKKHKN